MGKALFKSEQPRESLRQTLERALVFVIDRNARGMQEIVAGVKCQ